MNHAHALMRLGASTADAVQQVLRMFAPESVDPGSITTVPEDESPFVGAVTPGVATQVAYVDGVTGGNVLIIGNAGAARLAAAMMGSDPAEADVAGELGELEFSAVGEAMNQMMSSAAVATSKVLEEEIEISPPNIKRIAAPDEAFELTEAFGDDGQLVRIAFTFAGEPCVLVQFVPNAFIVRLTRAMDDSPPDLDEEQPLGESLRHVPVRMWAELGRARMPSGRLAALPGGTVVDLDREVDDAIDLYADGMRFATGRLLVTEEGGLAVRIETVVGLADTDLNTNMEVV